MKFSFALQYCGTRGCVLRYGVTTISLKLPEPLLARLEKESRARRTTKSSLVRECLEKQLSRRARVGEALPKLAPGKSFYDQALPILKKAWMRRGRG